MHSLAPETDVRAMNVVLDDARLVVDLMDGRTIAVPLAWYPRLANATPVTLRYSNLRQYRANGCRSRHRPTANGCVARA